MTCSVPVVKVSAPTRQRGRGITQGTVDATWCYFHTATKRGPPHRRFLCPPNWSLGPQGPKDPGWGSLSCQESSGRSKNRSHPPSPSFHPTLKTSLVHSHSRGRGGPAPQNRESPGWSAGGVSGGGRTFKLGSGEAWGLLRGGGLGPTPLLPVTQSSDTVIRYARHFCKD